MSLYFTPFTLFFTCHCISHSLPRVSRVILFHTLCPACHVLFYFTLFVPLFTCYFISHSLPRVSRGIIFHTLLPLFQMLTDGSLMRIVCTKRSLRLWCLVRLRPPARRREDIWQTRKHPRKTNTLDLSSGWISNHNIHDDLLWLML